MYKTIIDTHQHFYLLNCLPIALSHLLSFLPIAMAITKRQIDLFGGAITCSIPSHWRDVSTVRQVPDNQEVYQDCSEETGAVLVVEILQHHNVKNEDAAEFFFRDLAESNGCLDDNDWRLVSSRVISRENYGVSSNDEEKSEEQIILRTLLENIQQTSGANNNCCVIAIGSQNVVQGKAYTGTGAADEKTICIEMCILRLEHVETDLLITLSTPTEALAPVCDKNGILSAVMEDVLSGLRVKDWSLFG